MYETISSFQKKVFKMVLFSSGDPSIDVARASITLWDVARLHLIGSLSLAEGVVVHSYDLQLRRYCRTVSKTVKTM
jgi:hypothetical protein